MKYSMLLLAAAFELTAQPINVMPMPANVTRGEGSLVIDQAFQIETAGYADARLKAAADRFRGSLAKVTGMPLASGGNAVLTVRCDHAGKPVQSLGEDESYKLTVDTRGARIDAPTALGAMHGLETFLQLVEPGPHGYFVPAVTIEDKPRYEWRGLHIDVSRHWMPAPIILRQLDAMAAVKLNVFHWHLTDDQGFRIESKLFPKLQEMGSDGNYYTQEQVKQVVEYARDRGIRVIPEFDMPGHATSWLVGYPELASAPGPYRIERTWGVFEPTIDPTRESTYEFLDRFIGEMAALFPDEYFHIGGDEVKATSWNTSEHIVAFKKAHAMKDNHDLQSYFNKRVQEIVKKHGKRMEGWDEILASDLPKDIVIQSWRGQKSLAEAAQLGFQGILSSGYYLDHMESAAKHYMVDPSGDEAASLGEQEKSRILGGEVCMWNEYVSQEIIDGRIWPRTAAVAERLWSPATVTDITDMYRRLDLIDRRLRWAGIEERSQYQTMLERLAGTGPVWPLQVLADIVRPVSLDGRSHVHKYTQQTPLNRLVDTALPESRAARELADAIGRSSWPAVREYLVMWRDNDARLKPLLQRSSLLGELVPVSAAAARLAGIGLDALAYVEKHEKPPAGWTEQQRTFISGLTSNRRPPAEVVIMIADPVQKLVDLASASR
ncbi:MAG TPA: family 20 glycosylhydrolase [Bryobacteraceae bacterium]|nr:family 20 glycosylhydrolase [Bryobacteraceae bacterium]